jgi:hypothetical protein
MLETGRSKVVVLDGGPGDDGGPQPGSRCGADFLAVIDEVGPLYRLLRVVDRKPTRCLTALTPRLKQRDDGGIPRRPHGN